MRVTRFHFLLVRKFTSPGSLCDTSLEATLNGVASQIESTIKEPKLKQCICLLQSDFRQSLKFLSIHKHYHNALGRFACAITSFLKTPSDAARYTDVYANIHCKDFGAELSVCG